MKHLYRERGSWFSAEACRSSQTKSALPSVSLHFGQLERLRWCLLMAIPMGKFSQRAQWRPAGLSLLVPRARLWRT